ncbi:hypothetical protein FMN52_01050 [Marinobacter sp. BW6]|uniref:hypothetical protein n=1 Tax=Marinobacter sp. BW6 TaxID=2592624 RepID=UPI0011DE7068|nr:hypothetical protein [Marinobacter sp. BW6]TYC63843.1 hypothetical protein FMN52_01050 [Marinobacter sp. BW6]
MKFSKALTSCCFTTAILATGCGGGSAGDSSGSASEESGTLNPSEPIEIEVPKVDPKETVNAIVFDYPGMIKSVSASGKEFDPMTDEIGASNADSCVDRDDRYYDNGFVRVYSDGGVTDSELKVAGDQALGTLETALAAIGSSKEEFQSELFSTIRPRVIREIVDNYAVNGVPYFYFNYETGGSFTGVEYTVPLHDVAVELGYAMTQEERLLYESGDMQAYREAVAETFLELPSALREYDIISLQSKLADYDEFKSQENAGGIDYDAVGDPGFGIDVAYYERLAADPRYAAIFDSPVIDPVVNLCLLSQGNIPNEFDTEVGINSVTIATGTSNIEVGLSMAKYLGVHLATTYRYNYVANMPFWFTEGLAFSLIFPGFEKIEATTLVDQNALNRLDLNPEYYATIVEGIESEEENSQLTNLYFAQRFVSYSDGDSDSKGFNEAFEDLVQVSGYPNLTYSRFKSEFASIIDYLL